MVLAWIRRVRVRNYLKVRVLRISFLPMMGHGLGVDLEDVRPAVEVGHAELDFPVQTPRPRTI